MNLFRPRVQSPLCGLQRKSRIDFLPKYHFSITSMRTELVTTLKRKPAEILSELENEKAPILITQYGKPAAYLVDVETYNDLQRQLTMLRGIARGERAIEEGRTVPHAEAKKRMARWLK
jgi:prevent-host-death family protein